MDGGIADITPVITAAIIGDGATIGQRTIMGATTIWAVTTTGTIRTLTVCTAADGTIAGIRLIDGRKKRAMLYIRPFQLSIKLADPYIYRVAIQAISGKKLIDMPAFDAAPIIISGDKTMAARAIWTGVVTFGMVSIPVKLFSATENKDISFNQLHRDCMGRIKEQKFCPQCDRKIESEELEKGYEYAKGQYVVVSKDDLEKLPLPNKNIIEVSAFIKQDEIDPVFYDKSYYIEPEEKAMKPFALFMQAIKDKGVTAIATVSLRNKQRLCALRPLDGTLMMNTLLYPDEIRVEKGKPLPSVPVSPQELAMAGTLIDMMAQEFQPQNYTDHYREALMSIIDAKLQGKEVTDVPQPAAGKVIDLMEALQASMETLKNKKTTSAAAPAALTSTAETPATTVGEPTSVAEKSASRSKKKAATG